MDPHKLQARRIQLVRASLPMITPRAERIASRFYERLLARHPSLRPLFAHTDLGRQGRSLMWMIVWAVQQLDNLDELMPRLQELGKRHEGYGVRAEHYELVGACLIEALGHELGEFFPEALSLAWQDVYALMARAMQGVDALAE